MSLFGELFSWWHGQTLGTRLFTAMRGASVGTDSVGNRYFQEKRARNGNPARRWVIYNGEAEASRIPPEWHGWLHRTVQDPPTTEPPTIRPWEKPHQPNLTGTSGAYRPPGSLYREDGARPRARSYEPWVPK